LTNLTYVLETDEEDRDKEVFKQLNKFIYFLEKMGCVMR
jgi:hypothetical protein